jgi:putative transposase
VCRDKVRGIPRPRTCAGLTDNGSIYAAANTVDMAVALNLTACFTPIESPESNGIAEAFVKTFKRDYVRINHLPNARMVLAVIEG